MNSFTIKTNPLASLKVFFWIFISLGVLFTCSRQNKKEQGSSFRIEQDDQAGTISVYKEYGTEPVVVQNAKPDFRPFLHPIMAPDGNGMLTQYSPGHHKHQTGLYWGFTRINGQPIATDSLLKFFYSREKTEEQKKIAGRDFFHHPEGGYWKRISMNVIDSLGLEVKWQTVYHMLGEEGKAILEETQTWSMKEENGKFLLALEWKGKALIDITIGEFDYGGMFLRMPWRKDIKGEVVNFARQKNEKAEGQKALWVDVGMEIEGRDDWGHIAIFDHPDNRGFPQTWRVDGQLGVGPCHAIQGDWTIAKGETEIIKHQLTIYTGELNDLELTEDWKNYIGSDNIYSTAGLWSVAQNEAKQAKFLNPQEAVEAMTIQEGFKVNAWASEPMITQPMAFCWDDKGRFWVAENRDYESRGYGFSNSGDSRILILEDTDGDGLADSRKVFAEGIPFPAAIAVGFDGLFLGAPPNFLFVPDKNQDDKAEMEDIEVLLTGWGIRDRHETINSLHWGPDGWLYGLEGFATPSKIRKPKGKGKLYTKGEAFPEDLLEAEGVDINGGVWRYHPIKKRFEVVAHGFSNPWGIDYDAKGQLFISACVIPHLFHVIPGGIYHRQGGQHFNPYVYDDIQTIVDHRHRSAHGGARVYLSDAFPEEHQGRLFMANIHEHAVLSDILEKTGSGYIAHHGDDFMMANNAQWIGFSMEVGPGGNLYVLDWHDADICGNSVMQKETGRIFRISPEKSLAENWEGRYADLNTFTDLQLVELQTSKSSWHARRARVILQYRASQQALSEDAQSRLVEIFKSSSSEDIRLQALWTLHITGKWNEADLLTILNDKNEYIRAWAIQFICEDLTPSREAITLFEKMAQQDPSPIVGLYLAGALQRIPEENRWGIASALLQRSKDAEDHNIPKMIWFGTEPLISNNADKAIQLALDSKIPKLSEYIARRLVEAGDLEALIAALENKSPNQVAILTGIQAEVENRSDIEIPSNWSLVYNKLKNRKATAKIALEIAQQLGDAEAAKELMTTLQNQDAPINSRLDALNSLANRSWPELPELLDDLLKEEALRIPAIRATTNYVDGDIAWYLLYKKYKEFSIEEKQEVVLALASRPEYAKTLTNAIKNEDISRSEIPAYVARQLRRVMGNGFVEIWGPIDQISEDLEASYAKYKSLLTNQAIQSANQSEGRMVFQRTCYACHKMYGEGGILGPDITGSNRQNLDYLLSNVLEPSAEIQDDYKMIVITARDGRTYLGNLVGETDRQITLNVVGQDKVVLNKSEIQSREDTPNSLMPPGLFETLTDEEVINLVAYLQGREQVELSMND